MGRRRLLGVSLTVAFGFLTQLGWAAEKNDDVMKIGKRTVARRSIISKEKELAIGKQYATQVDGKIRFITDPAVDAYIGGVTDLIARNSDLRAAPSVKVIDSPQVSAFTLPGGFLYVSAGLIFFVDDEGQLAGALAHEIAHLAVRHWASMMDRAMLAQFAMLPLLFSPVPNSASRPPPLPVLYPPPTGVPVIPEFGMPVPFLKMSREDEAEADYLGLQYMYKAAYDPSSYTAFLRKIGKVEQPGQRTVPDTFMVRPSTAKRISTSEREIGAVLPPVAQSLVTTSELEDVKARLRTLVSSFTRED